MPDFSKAQVGDRVFSITNGWGVIDEVWENDQFPLVVRFTDGNTESYTMTGKLGTLDAVPDLYWDEVTLIVPDSAVKPPVRKVKRWICLFLSAVDEIWVSGSGCKVTIFKTEEEARVHSKKHGGLGYTDPVEVEIPENWLGKEE